MKTREQAEQVAMELFPDPNHDTHWERERVKFLRQGFMQCYDELFKMKDLSQTCGYCVKPSKEIQRKLLSEIMREDENDGIYDLTRNDFQELLNESENEINSFQKHNQLREAAEKFVKIHNLRDSFPNWTKWSEEMESAFEQLEKALK